jgi:hypothetical protein
MTGNTRTRRHFAQAVGDPQVEWSRRRLQTLLIGGVVLALALIAGAVWRTVGLLTDQNASPTSRHETGHEGSAVSAEDELAARSLPTAGLDDARPGELSTGTTGTIELPAAGRIGPAGVLTGFPHTPEGALAQLAAIDQVALASASVPRAQEVIEQWAVEGGPTTESWSGVKAVAGFLSGAGARSGASEGNGLVVNVIPSMGFIKGTVGDDYVVPCLDMVLEVTTTTGAGGEPIRIAAADCQRMTWDSTDECWLIGPGVEPAEAPALWPGTQASYDVGYQWLEQTP